jgi:hypothetical protein
MLSIAFSVISFLTSLGVWAASLLIQLIGSAPITSTALIGGYGLYCREDDGDLFYCIPYRKVLARIFHQVEKFIWE